MRVLSVTIFLQAVTRISSETSRSWALKLFTLHLHIFETILLEYGPQRLINDGDLIIQSPVIFRFSTHDPHTQLSNWVTLNSLDAPCGLWRASTTHTLNGFK